MPTEAIRVFARFRPKNKAEMINNPDGKNDLVTLDTENHIVSIIVTEGEKPKRFDFDHIFKTDATQAFVFDVAGSSLVDNVLNGFNSTLFAYGQTGAGKTFSLVGMLDNPELFGLMPRVTKYMFGKLKSNPEIESAQVKMMVTEIYNDKLFDLIKVSKKELKIRQKRSGATYIEGVVEKEVNTEEEVFAQMTESFNNRSTAATKMNATSSRSHCIFCFTLNQKMKDGQGKTSRLYICDLAGSERAAKTGASGTQLEEAKAINGSLTALGNVINALSTRDPKKKGKQKHIPFRNSTLTYLLKDSLQGNTKTILFLAATQDSWNLEETVSTMRFGARAKLIKNKVIVNKEFSPGEMKKVMAENEKYLIMAAKLFLGIQDNKFEKKKCETPTRNFLSAMRGHLKEDFPKASKAKALATVKQEKPVATEVKGKGKNGKAAKPKSAEKKKKEKEEKKERLSAEHAIVYEKLDAEIAALLLESQTSSTEATSCTKETDDKKAIILKLEKDIAYFKEEIEKTPVVDDNLPQVDVEEDANDSEEIAKYKRDLRVYKYTLELTRAEWKKNQSLAIEKMNAHREIIYKYKDDKKTLLALVSSLEGKLNEANERLREGRRQQREVNDLIRMGVLKRNTKGEKNAFKEFSQ